MKKAKTPVRKMLVSIHDVGPRFAEEIARLRECLAARVPLAHVAMLVVPDHWATAPLAQDQAFAARLREWAREGCDVFVHGWYHRDDTPHAGRLARWKARRMTAGEGEFLGLGRDEAARRMADGRALIEDVIGRPAAGFIAPAWLYGEGAHLALADSGFAMAEDHLRVWRPSTGERLCGGPVVTWASRSRPRIASSLLAAAVLRSALRPLPAVRVAVHPGDTHVPMLMASIDGTLRTLLRHRRTANYRDLLSASAS